MNWFAAVFLLIALNSISNASPQWLYRGDLGDLDAQPSNNKEVSKSETPEPAKLSREDLTFNDPQNASLYFDYPVSYSSISHYNTTVPTNETSGRALDLDALLSGIKQRNTDGHRESRIVNDNGSKNNLAIQGFIPIISLAANQEEAKSKPSKFEQYSGSNYEQQSYAGPQDAKFFGGALQGLANSLAGKRKYGHGYQQHFDQPECICVPFYMCKNGFIKNMAKNSRGIQQNNPANFQNSFEAAQSEINRFSVPPQLNSYYQQQNLKQQSQKQQFVLDQTQYQPQYVQEQTQYQPQYSAPDIIPPKQPENSYLPIDERSVDGSEGSSNTYFQTNETSPQYASEVLSRMLGSNSPGSCGVLRTCCKVVPDSYPDFELPHHIQNQENQYYPNPLSISNQPDNSYTLLGNPRPRPGFQAPLYPNFNKPNRNQFQILKPYESLNMPMRPPPVHHGYRPGRPFQKPNYPNTYPIPVRPSKPIQLYPENNHQNFITKPAHIPQNYGSCGTRHSTGVQGRVQNLQYHESSSEFGEYPWQAAILKRLGPADSLYVCGGTLISDYWVLTAAHCIKQNGPADLKIRLGEWDVHREDEFYPYVEKYVQEIIMHPEFFPGNLVNDIALLRLDSPVDLRSPHIATACLPDNYDHFAGHRCWVTGWGKDSFGQQGEYQSVLKEVDVPVQRNDECEHVLRQTRLGGRFILDRSFICAGGEPGKDACEGDGGSPLICEVNGIWKVAGLVSWGIGCGQPGIPGVYVNVANFRPWIDSIVNRYARGSQSSEPYGSFAPGIISERSNSKSGNETENEGKLSINLYKINENGKNTTISSEPARS